MTKFDYANSKMAFLIAEYVHSERDRGILSRRYLDRIGHERIAEEFQMSVRQIQNIDYRFQKKVILPHKDELL